MAQREFRTTASGFEPIMLTLQWPDEPGEFADRFGLDVDGVLRHAAADLIIAAQNSIKNKIKKGDDVADIQAWLDDWKVGTRGPSDRVGRAPGKKTTMKGLEALVSSAPPDKKAALEAILEQLKALNLG